MRYSMSCPGGVQAGTRTFTVTMGTGGSIGQGGGSGGGNGGKHTGPGPHGSSKIAGGTIGIQQGPSARPAVKPQPNSHAAASHIPKLFRAKPIPTSVARHDAHRPRRDHESENADCRPGVCDCLHHLARTQCPTTFADPHAPHRRSNPTTPPRLRGYSRGGCHTSETATRRGKSAPIRCPCIIRKSAID